MRRIWLGLLGALLASRARTAAADDTAPVADAPDQPVRRRDATWGQVFGGPFRPSQLFAMPIADVVGAYQIRAVGDASLLSESEVLSTSSVVAIGFGDLAQLEYRRSVAVSGRSDADLDATVPQLIGLPTLGVQLQLPVRRSYLPRLAAALRFGLAHAESSAAGDVDYLERATDLYLVASYAFGTVDVHAGVRISQATIEVDADRTPSHDAVGADETLVMPALGAAWSASPTTAYVVEASLVPRFDVGTSPRLGTDPYARAGVRWQLRPWLTVDASMGFHIEIARQMNDRAGVGSLVDWDIRLGAEVAVPWGAMLCRGIGLFCS